MLFVLGLFIVPTPVQAATLTVTNLDDSGSGSLRQSIADANPGDQITFDVTGTINLTSGSLLIDKDLTITGPVEGLTIDAGGNSRVFNINDGTESVATVSLSNLTISGGLNSTLLTPNGGGLVSYEALTLTNVTITNNEVSFGFGGGLHSAAGSLTVSDSSISNNRAALGGGGFSNLAADVTFTTVTISGNTAAAGTGAGLTNSAMMTINDSVISGNTTPLAVGGGVANTGGTLILNNTQVLDNVTESGIGAGLANNLGTMTLNDSIVSGNTTLLGAGGGIANNIGTVTVNNTVVTDNEATVGAGGGINNLVGTITITNGSEITENLAAVGGGISNTLDTMLIDGGSRVTDNNATTGGGIANFDNLRVVNATISGNVATTGFGGGVANIGVVYMTNVLLNGNSAVGLGGAIANGGDLESPEPPDELDLDQPEAPAASDVGASEITLTNVTIAENLGLDGAGIYNFSQGGITVQNSIVWGNLLGQASPLVTMDFSHSLVQNNLPDGPGNLDGTTVARPFAGNSDFQLSEDSPAINAGDNTADPDGAEDSGVLGEGDYATDLNGDLRIQGETIDLGAYESGGEGGGVNPPTGLVSNGDFEAVSAWSLTMQGAPSGYFTNPDRVHGGSVAMLFAGAEDGSGDREFITQDIAVADGTAGDGYQMTYYWGGLGVGSAGFIGARIILLNGDDVVDMETCLYTGPRGSFDWTSTQTCTLQAASGAYDTVQVLFGWLDVDAGFLGLDDVSLTRQ
ncbi:MAG: hypothetical protein GYB68_07905 [Chloroflexi bacterium]|nr:hypothetical protein [Chloroflexota bacterium]